MALTNVKETFDEMPKLFNANAAKGMNVVYQFDITGEGGGNWNVVIQEGTCKVQEGKASNPTVALTMSSETWLAMVNKQTNGMQAFMTGKLKLSGNMILAQKIPEIFPS